MKLYFACLNHSFDKYYNYERSVTVNHTFLKASFAVAFAAGRSRTHGRSVTVSDF